MAAESMAFAPSQKATRQSRLPANPTRTTAVVSLDPSSMAVPMRVRTLARVHQLFSGTKRAILSPFGDKLSSQRIRPYADCLSAAPRSCPKTVSDSFLHDFRWDCLNAMHRCPTIEPWIRDYSLRHIRSHQYGPNRRDTCPQMGPLECYLLSPGLQDPDL
jgi:hypothetical protein